MSFEQDVEKFVIKLEADRKEVFLQTAATVFTSVVEGSPITGAPGQPIDTGALRASWSLAFESPTSALIASNIEYAPHVEDNVNGVTFKVNGPHSVKMTIAGIQRIVDDAVLKVVR